MNKRSIIACIMKDYTIQLDTGKNIRIKNEKKELVIFATTKTTRSIFMASFLIGMKKNKDMMKVELAI